MLESSPSAEEADEEAGAAAVEFVSFDCSKNN